jgi:multisubunit Na+/H+ antiporter MnhG subunit
MTRIILPIITLVIGGLFGGALWHVYKSGRAENAERWGMILAFLGVFCAAIDKGYFATQGTSSETLTTGFFMVISSVGANLLASGVASRMRR